MVDFSVLWSLATKIFIADSILMKQIQSRHSNDTVQVLGLGLGLGLVRVSDRVD